MKTVVQLSYLALFMDFHLVLATQSLTCVNDYINNITCVWRRPPEQQNAACWLRAKKWESWRTCELKSEAGPDGSAHSCHVVFENKMFFSLDKIFLEVKCGNAVVTTLKDFQPRLHVKMHPPGSPVVISSNITWTRGTPFSDFIFSYQFQMQYKQESESWEDTLTINVTGSQTWVDVPEEKLVTGVLYQARVRVKPWEHLDGEWSDWSPVSTWKIEAISQPPRDVRVNLHVWLTMTGFVVLVLIIFVYYKYFETWLYRLRCQYIPDPSKYFEALNSIHGGNFQKWLSPMFPAESFDVLHCSEDISAVELSREKSTMPSEQDHSSTTKHCDGSSRVFLPGLGYLYSRKPSSYEIEPCSVYFSYQLEEGLPGRQASNKGGESEGGQGSLQASSSYECLEKLGNLQEHSQTCESGNEERTGEGEEEETGLRGGVPHSSPLAPWPFPAPFQPLPFLEPNSQFLHCFPQLTYPLQIPLPEFNLGAAQTANPPSEAFGPTRSSSLKVQPSSGGYMSLPDMKMNSGNKSI